MKNVLLAGFLILVLTGCEATLDGSSYDALIESKKEMRSQLTNEQVATMNTDIFNATGGMPTEQALDVLDGLTYDELHYLGQKTKLSGITQIFKKAQDDSAKRIELLQKELENKKLLQEQSRKIQLIASFEAGISELSGRREFSAFSIQVTNNSNLELRSLYAGINFDSPDSDFYPLNPDTPIRPGETRIIPFNNLESLIVPANVPDNIRQSASFVVIQLVTTADEVYEPDSFKIIEQQIAGERNNIAYAGEESKKYEAQLSDLK